MLHFGQMRCGKVDQFAGLFHVVTEFFHVNFVPLVPVRSFLVPTLDVPLMGGTGGEVPIKLSVKSVLTAWVRTALVLLVLFNVLFFLGNLVRWVVTWARPGAAPPPEMLPDALLNPLALAIGFAIFLGLTYRFSKAGYDRAVELAALLGLTEDDLNARRDGAAPPVHPTDAYAN